MSNLAFVLILVLSSKTEVSPFKLSRKLPLVNNNDSDVGLNTVQMIEKHGYVCETHTITTEDGYILTYHRIPHKVNDINVNNRPSVLMMHGLASSSADFVNTGTKRSLGFLLVDAGYDVWLANARGNAWSRNHITLDVDKDKEKFFDFSWHEMGYYDLAAAIDYILNINGDDSLHYIGHSQGCTAFFVLGSTRPEYNRKIKIASLMGPAALFDNYSNDFVKAMCKYIDIIHKLLKELKIYEVPELVKKIVSDFCVLLEFYRICVAILFELAGADEAQIDKNIIPVMFTNFPSNAAVKQFIHYGQQMRAGGFSHFHYGTAGNRKVYGSDTPPPYNFSKISAPIALYYGKNDEMVNYMDISTIIKQLPNVANDYLVPYDAFNHFDFIIAKDVVGLLYNELISVMQKY